MIDIHNHIIPDIDDGAKTADDALALLRMAVDDGVTRLVCTPHMHPGRFNNDITTIEPAFASLQALVVEWNLPIELAMAAEVHFSDEIIMQLKHNKVPFLGQFKQQSVVLLEMPHDRVPLAIGNLLNWLNERNIVAMIAHPERNKELMDYPERTFELANKGALFQLTAASVIGNMGANALRTAQWFLKQDLAFCVASDAHNVKYRPTAMGAAYGALSKIGGRDLAERLCVLNPGRLTESLFE